MHAATSYRRIDVRSAEYAVGLFGDDAPQVLARRAADLAEAAAWATGSRRQALKRRQRRTERVLALVARGAS